MAKNDFEKILKFEEKNEGALVGLQKVKKGIENYKLRMKQMSSKMINSLDYSDEYLKILISNKEKH